MELWRWLEDTEKKPVYSAKVFVHYSVDNKSSRRHIFEIYILEKNLKHKEWIEMVFPVIRRNSMGRNSDERK